MIEALRIWDGSLNLVAPCVILVPRLWRAAAPRVSLDCYPGRMRRTRFGDSVKG